MDDRDLLGSAEKHVVREFVKNLENLETKLSKLLNGVEEMQTHNWGAIMLDSKKRDLMIEMHETALSKLPENVDHANLVVTIMNVMFKTEDDS